MAALSLRTALAFLALLCALPIQASSLAERIDGQLQQPRFAGASWGIKVVALDDGHTVYEHDAGRLLLPASTAKLYTAAFALDRLGADGRTHTDVVAAGEVSRGRLHGALVLRGRGDPTLMGTDWADTLANQVVARGIRRIDGGIVGDDTAFTGPPHGSGWEVDDLQAYFGASTAALDIDENTMVADISAQGVRVTPADAAIALAGQPADTLQVYREPGSATVHILGGVAQGAPARRLALSIPDPALTAARRLQAALERQGVRVDGEARSLRWPVPPPSGDVVATLPSPTIADILRTGLKRSQNLYLQSVFLLTGLAATEQTAPRAEDRAAQALSSWLEGHGIAPTETMLVEGTGLSRHDLTTAASLVRILALMDASPQAALWRGLLPVAGVDGTLANRMRDTAAAGNVQAKTGSMSFVNALAGYVTTKSGQRLAFAIVLNNYRAPAGALPVSAEVDAVAVMLAEGSEKL